MNTRTLLAVIVTIGCSRTTSPTTRLPDAHTDEANQVDSGVLTDVTHDVRQDVSAWVDNGPSGPMARDALVQRDCFGGYEFPADADITNPPPMEQWPTRTCGLPGVPTSFVCCPESEVYDQAPSDAIRDGVRCTSFYNCRLTWRE